MSNDSEALIANSKIKPVGYVQKQAILTYEPMVPMYATKGEAENGYEMVSLYSADQVGWIIEESLRQQQGEPVAWISHNNLTGRDTYGKLPVQSLQAGVYSHTPLFTHPPAGRELSDEEIKYMVNRFLGWRLPEHFNPDCGISFKPDPRWTVPMQPIGTNLFSAEQAEQMVRYMLDGIAAAKEPK